MDEAQESVILQNFLSDCDAQWSLEDSRLEAEIQNSITLDRQISSCNTICDEVTWDLMIDLQEAFAWKNSGNFKVVLWLLGTAPPPP